MVLGYPKVLWLWLCIKLLVISQKSPSHELWSSEIKVEIQLSDGRGLKRRSCWLTAEGMAELVTHLCLYSLCMSTPSFRVLTLNPHWKLHLQLIESTLTCGPRNFKVLLLWYVSILAVSPVMLILLLCFWDLMGYNRHVNIRPPEPNEKLIFWRFRVDKKLTLLREVFLHTAS